MNTVAHRLQPWLGGLRLWRILVPCLLCGLPLLGQAQSSPSPPARLGVPETLLGILSYARWPSETAPLRLCVLGQSIHTERLLKDGLEGLAQHPITVQRFALDREADIVAQCDALYVGALEEAAWRRILAKVLGHPVLTVCERSPVCAAGAMVCLDIDDNTKVQFEVNLDSVARSSVRLNPLVLRLGQRKARP